MNTIKPASLSPNFEVDDGPLLIELPPRAVLAFKLEDTAWHESVTGEALIGSGDPEAKVMVGYRAQISRVAGEPFHVLYTHWVKVVGGGHRHQPSLATFLGNPLGCNCNQSSVADRLYLASNLEELFKLARTLLSAVGPITPKTPSVVQQLATQAAAILSAERSGQTTPS